MPYLRPPSAVRRLFDPIAMRLGVGGTRVLEVRARRSGRVQRVPLIPVEVSGTVYLVAARGETDWARNLRAAGRCRLGRHGRERDYDARELPVAERAEIIAAYRTVAGRAVRSFFERSPDPADHPVFRLSSR